MVLPPVSRSFLELLSTLQNLSYIYLSSQSPLPLSLASLCFSHLSHKPFIGSSQGCSSQFPLLAWSSTLTTFIYIYPSNLILFNTFALSYSYHCSNISLYHLFEEVEGERQKEDSICGLTPIQVVLPDNLMSLNIKQSYEATITLIPKPDENTTKKKITS